ncbi:hypothetical protein P9209_20260 [Prescottella defluvii]|nr:hypothetical protein P9209_20260 [Prescottella defluvii]
MSTYDSNWLESYGGCDGVTENGACRTERRTADNGYFPKHMTPNENPFYLDVPFDDVNDETAFAQRGSAVPWADEAPYRDHVSDPSVSLMKNRWVRIRSGATRATARSRMPGRRTTTIPHTSSARTTPDPPAASSTAQVSTFLRH